MANIKIENIVAHAKIADTLDINIISEKNIDFQYSPDEFPGLTYRINEPKVAVLIFPNGKIVSTGAKTINDAEKTIKKVVEKIKKSNIKISSKYDIETENVIASTDFKKELHLSSISTGLYSENVEYIPEEFPGLIIRLESPVAVLLLFSSGKLVCTGAKTIEDATNAINMMEEKLSSLGVL